MTDANMTHAEAELLLPWLANNTLDETESSAVRRHLASCRDCRDSLGLFYQIQSAINDSNTVPIVPRPDAGALLERIESADAKQAGFRITRTRLAASLVILAVLAGLLMNNLEPRQEPIMFETATGPGVLTEVHYVFDVDFSSDVTPDQRREIIGELGGTDVSTEPGSSVRRIVFPLAAGTLSELEAFTDQITDSPMINSVTVVAVQLPAVSGDEH